MKHITKPRTDGCLTHKNTRKGKYMAHIMGLSEIHTASLTLTQTGLPISGVIYFKLWETSECNNSRQRWVFLEVWSVAVNLTVRGRSRNPSISLTKYWNGRSSHHEESIINQHTVMTTLQNDQAFNRGAIGVNVLKLIVLLVHIYSFKVVFLLVWYLTRKSHF